MVGKVLTGNGITTYGNGATSLIGGDELSDTECDELQQLCRQPLDAFQEQRGEVVFVHRSRYRTPITSSRVSTTAVSVWVSTGSTKVWPPASPPAPRTPGTSRDGDGGKRHALRHAVEARLHVVVAFPQAAGLHRDAPHIDRVPLLFLGGEIAGHRCSVGQKESSVWPVKRPA